MLHIQQNIEDHFALLNQSLTEEGRMWSGSHSCILVERNTILSTSFPQKLPRQTQILTSFLNTTCSTLKDSPCGNQRVREIRMEFFRDNKEPCITYRKTFCEINKALRELTHTCKNITSPVIEEMSDFLKRPVSCTLSTVRTTMKEFCPKLRDYFQRLYNICTV